MWGKTVDLVLYPNVVVSLSDAVPSLRSFPAHTCFHYRLPPQPLSIDPIPCMRVSLSFPLLPLEV